MLIGERFDGQHLSFRNHARFRLSLGYFTEPDVHLRHPKDHMTYAPGTVLIHPSHGPMRVVSTTSRRFPNGDRHECLNLEALDTHTLAITIPIDQYGASGLRSVVTGEAFDALFGTLGEATGEVSENWSRRYKANEQKVRSGSVLSLAEVVRDLLRRREVKHLALGERNTLAQGMSQLAREVLYSKSLDSMDVAEQLIKDAALGVRSEP